MAWGRTKLYVRFQSAEGVDMIITGPFLPNVSYADLHVELTHNEPIFEIEIVDSALYQYRHMSYKFMQNLHVSHDDSVINYVKIGDVYTFIPFKQSPYQICEYIEERIRLSETQLTGQSGLTLGFRIDSFNEAQVYVKDLVFGERNIDPDIPNMPVGIFVYAVGGGEISPSEGYNPMTVGEPITVKLYPYMGYTVSRVKIDGTAYDSSDRQLPRFINVVDNEFTVKLLSPFDSCTIVAEFRVM